MPAPANWYRSSGEFSLAASGRGMLGQDERRGLLAGRLEVPEKIGQPLPDLRTGGLALAEPEDRTGSPLHRQLGAVRIDGVAHGRRVAGIGQLDRQEQLQRCSPIGQRVERLARDEEDAAPLLGHELGEILHLRVAQEARVGITHDHHVECEQLVLGGGECRQGRAVLLAVLGIRREQHHAQVDRLLALEVILQVAELVAGLALHQQHLELLLADGDHALDPVVLDLKLARLGLDLQDERALARGLGPVHQLDPPGLAVGGASTSVEASSRAALGSALVASRSLSRTTTFWPWKPRASSLAWNRTASSTKTTSSTSSSVSSRSRAGSALPRPIVNRGTPFRADSSAALASGSPSVVWPSVRSTIAEGGAPRSSVRTCRVASPSRDWLPVPSHRAQLVGGRHDLRGPVHLGQQPGGVRDQVEPDLVLLLQLLDQASLVLAESAPWRSRSA